MPVDAPVVAPTPVPVAAPATPIVPVPAPPEMPIADPANAHADTDGDDGDPDDTDVGAEAPRIALADNSPTVNLTPTIIAIQARQEEAHRQHRAPTIGTNEILTEAAQRLANGMDFDGDEGFVDATSISPAQSTGLASDSPNQARPVPINPHAQLETHQKKKRETHNLPRDPTTNEPATRPNTSTQDTRYLHQFTTERNQGSCTGPQAHPGTSRNAKHARSEKGQPRQINQEQTHPEHEAKAGRQQLKGRKKESEIEEEVKQKHIEVNGRFYDEEVTKERERQQQTKDPKDAAVTIGSNSLRQNSQTRPINMPKFSEPKKRLCKPEPITKTRTTNSKGQGKHIETPPKERKAILIPNPTTTKAIPCTPELPKHPMQTQFKTTSPTRAAPADPEAITTDWSHAKAIDDKTSATNDNPPPQTNAVTDDPKTLNDNAPPTATDDTLRATNGNALPNANDHDPPHAPERRRTTSRDRRLDRHEQN